MRLWLSPRRVRVRLVVAWLLLRVVAWLLTVVLVRVPVHLRLGWLVPMARLSLAPWMALLSLLWAVLVLPLAG